MGTKRILFLGALLAARTVVLVGEEPAKKDKKPKAKADASATVTVTAEARPVEVLATPNPVKVADTERIRESGAHGATSLLADLLPGQVMANGGQGTTASLFLGGARSADAVVLLDGLRITEPGGMGADLSLYTLTGIDRAEVLVGPASTLYGSDAHGGVIAFTSPGSAPQGYSGELSGALGTSSLRSGSSHNAYGWGSGWLRTNLAAMAQEQPTPTDNPFRTTGVFLGLGQYLGADTLISLSHRNTYQATPIPWNWSGLQRTYEPRRESTARMESTVLSLHANLGPSLSSELTLGRLEIERGSHGQAYPYTPSSRRDQAVATLTFTQPRWSTTLRLDGSSEQSWTDLSAKGLGHHQALVLEATGEPLAGLRFVGSLRRQEDRLRQDGYGDPEAKVWQTTWKAGVNYRHQAWRAYFNTGTSFNTPSLYAFGANLANDQPQPGNEKSHSLLAGLGWADGAWALRLDANRIQYDNLLSYIWLGGFNGYFENRNQVRIQGLELTAGWHNPTWNLEAFARSQEGRDLRRPENQQLRFFQNRPFFTAGLRAFASFDDWTLSGRFAYLGHRYVYSSDAGGTAAERTHFADLAFQAGYRVRKNLEVILRAEHLLQDPFTRTDWEQGKDLGANNVAVIPGYPAPTRNLTLEARYRF